MKKSKKNFIKMIAVLAILAMYMLIMRGCVDGEDDTRERGMCDQLSSRGLCIENMMKVFCTGNYSKSGTCPTSYSATENKVWGCEVTNGSGETWWFYTPRYTQSFADNWCNKGGGTGLVP